MFGPPIRMAFEGPQSGKQVLVLRPPRDSDIGHYVKLRNQDYETQKFLHTRRGISTKDAEEIFENDRTNKATVWMVAVETPEKKDDDFVGICELRDQGQRWYEGGIYLVNQEQWGKGIASLVAKALVWFGFEELDACALKSTYFTGNVASQKVSERLGFTKSGCDRAFYLADGEYRDRVWLVCYNPRHLETLFGEVPVELVEQRDTVQKALKEVRQLFTAARELATG